MSRLLLAFLVFVALHSIPAMPKLRSGLVSRIGRRAYLAAYSLVSTLSLVWLFYEALNTDYVELWQPAPWQAWITLVLSPVGLFFVIAGLISPNPLSVTARRSDDAPGAIVSITRHPVLWGFLFWSAGHIVPNGDVRSLILFGGFALFSLAGIVLAERRSRKSLGENWEAVARPTSIVPFGALLAGRASLSADRSLAIAIAASAIVTLWLLTGGHLQFFGVDPLLSAMP